MLLHAHFHFSLFAASRCDGDASVYKHYKSKQDIFHAIFEETARRYEAFTDTISVHAQNSEQDVILFENITADDLVEKVKSLIEYSLHDEYVSMFRRMMTIEQFRSTELSALYSQRYVNQKGICVLGGKNGKAYFSRYDTFSTYAYDSVKNKVTTVISNKLVIE